MVVKPSGQKPLHFVKAFEINGISPLPHYFEEIYTNQVGIKQLGMRGDKNYLFYSYDGFGAGYYEATEEKLSARSTYNFFKSPTARTNFFKGIERVIAELSHYTAKIDKLDLSKLSIKQAANYFLEANRLHGKIFSYFAISQPYRIKLFEAELRDELQKRVATSRIDAYMNLLATSEKPSKLAYEELDWLKLLIKHKAKLNVRMDVKKLQDQYPELYNDIVKHFHTYKVLTLGDGNWQYDINHYLNSLKRDIQQTTNSLQRRYLELINQPQEVLATRQRLIKELYLKPETVKLIEFLAEVGHSRLKMRIEGWVPFIMTIIKLDIALSNSLNFGKGLMLNFMSEKELIKLAKTGRSVSEQELLDRMGKHSEFLILNDNGKFRMLYGKAAGQKFKQLAPPINHTKTNELSGSTGVKGYIKGTVCLYKWGDDISSKLASIKKHKILVAGQTRPSMMPIIRLAQGIVTDEGGITSHAAIVSRELGIPSVIGTIYATQVFKEGDEIELDADNGIVRKLS